MTSTQIPFSSTGFFSNLILDYIDQKPSLNPFYKYKNTIEEIEEIILNKKNEQINRPLLASTIEQQYKNGIDINIHPNCSNNIHVLKDENAFCIVTAHQLNIFTGPLYLIYKVAQTISTCKQLKIKYPNYHFVPVYWLGSEDHDFEEINHIHLFQKKIEWFDKQGGATGRYSLNTIHTVVDEIKNVLGNSAYTTHLISIFEQAYQQKKLAQATRFLFNELFGQYGLVVIDGDDVTFKQQFSEIMKDELLHQNTIQFVNQQINQIEAKGYKQQAFPRDINLFYLSKNSRERIVKEHEIYKIQNTTIQFTTDEILMELKNHPERFSPNVILRPLFQQKILPALSFIGGAGEISYWLQLQPVFDFYKINFPQLILRNSALLISSNLENKIEKLALNQNDFFNDIESIKKQFIAHHTNDDIDVSNIKNVIEQAFIQLQSLTKSIDESLVNTVGAELQKTLHSIDGLQKRMLKSLKQKNETQLNQIEKIKQQLFPANNLQERVENFSSYYAQYGQSFLDILINEFDVYHKQFLIFHLS